MDKKDTEILENFIDKYSLKEVISTISYICGEKSMHIAENWQDIALAKRWMSASVRLDNISDKIDI